MGSIVVNDTLISIGQHFKCSKCQEMKKAAEFLTYNQSGIFKLTNIYCKTCLDKKNNVNVDTTFEFSILKDSILSLFDTTFSLHGYISNFADLQAGTGAHNYKKNLNKLLINAVGNVECFRELLRIELNQFFNDFPKYFATNDDQMNSKRFYEYKRMILDRKCKRKLFKRELIACIKSDLCPCYEKTSVKFLDEYKDMSLRQKIIITSIKTFIYRTFLINEYCID